jgi:hypothetical protein
MASIARDALRLLARGTIVGVGRVGRNEDRQFYQLPVIVAREGDPVRVR